MKTFIKSLALLAAALVLSACATKPNTQVLSKAFENQKYKVVEKQIEAGVDINAPADEAGNTVLQQAILRGDSKAFEYLVANSANPFVRNKNNQTAVDLALNSSSDYFISWAKAASQESNGSNAYKQAIQAINNNDAETLKTLLQGNAFYWYSMPLIGHKAVDVSCVDCLKVLIEAGYDFTKVNDISDTPLVTAVIGTKVEAVKLLAEDKAALNAKNKNGGNVLHSFFMGFHSFPARLSQAEVAKARLDILHTLIKLGADVNLADNQGLTPLNHSIQYAKKDEINELLQGGANPNLAPKSGYFPLLSAVNNGRLDIVELLLAKGADTSKNDDTGWTALHYVANGSESAKQQDAVQAEIARVLVKAGADLNAKTQAGQTPVYLAVTNNRPLTAKVLIEAGADINIATNDGWTPLMKAIFEGNLEIVKLLLASSNLMINQQTGDGWTALHFTVNKSGVPEKNEELAAQMAQLLINKKANLNLRTQAGYTPLMLAVMNNRIKTMGVLLRAKADPALADSDGWTPLMRAVFDGNLEAATLLAQTKKGINTKGPLGWTALHFCSNVAENGTRTKDAQLVDLLIKNGAAIETKIQDGRTPLTLAVVNGRSEVVQALLKHKPNKQVVDNKGYTALDYALDNKNWAVAGLLQGISAREAYEESLYPVKPAARAGYTTCNTRCFNGDCYRTYADGRKEHFQAQQKYNPISGNWEYDSGSCN